MTTVTKLFTSNRTQAVGLPKDVAFPDTVQNVRVFRRGRRRIVVPTDAVRDDFFDARADPDLPAERDQPGLQAREPL